MSSQGFRFRLFLWAVLSGLASAALAFALGFLWIVQSLELRTLDWRYRLLSAPTPQTDKVALVVVDDSSIEEAAKEAS